VKSWLGILLLTLGLSCMARGQGFIVGFSQSVYEIDPGKLVTVPVEFKSTLPVGIFSFGIRFLHDPADAPFLSDLAIQVPVELDFDGVNGAGAARYFGAGWGGVKGTVDFDANPIEYYTGTLLAVFQWTPPKPGSFLLTLEILRTLGPTEQVFVAGDGTVLDSQLQFGSARVLVIPEPGPMVLLGLGVVAVVASSRTRSAAAGGDRGGRRGTRTVPAPPPPWATPGRRRGRGL